MIKQETVSSQIPCCYRGISLYCFKDGGDNGALMKSLTGLLQLGYLWCGDGSELVKRGLMPVTVLLRPGW